MLVALVDVRLWGTSRHSAPVGFGLLMTRSRHRPPQRRDESPAVQWSPGAPTQFWLQRTNVWRRATSPRTGQSD